MNEKEVINACIVEVLKGIKAEVENMYGVTDTDAHIWKPMIDKYDVLDLIDRKIKEHGGEA